jgi:hypothetical protein
MKLFFQTDNGFEDEQQLSNDQVDRVFDEEDDAVDEQISTNDQTFDEHDAVDNHVSEDDESDEEYYFDGDLIERELVYQELERPDEEYELQEPLCAPGFFTDDVMEAYKVVSFIPAKQV